jgi:Ca-activated chloride channel family protein
MQASPGWVAVDGAPLFEASEVLVDEAMAMERRPSREQYQQFQKGARAYSLTAAGVAARSPAPAGAYGKAIALESAGNFPRAWLVELRAGGARFELGAECTIGRTATADIRVQSASVSRRHTSVYALSGEFWIADLGSTNPTSVNGEQLGSKPRKLAHGDEVAIGDVRLRYEEEAR